MERLTILSEKDSQHEVQEHHVAGFSFTTIDFPGAAGTYPWGVNNANPSQIVGWYVDTTGKEHGFLLAAGSFSTIEVPGAASTVAYGINNSGQIVGRYTDHTGLWRGFSLAAGSFTIIDVPGALLTVAQGINNSGQIVGRYTDDAGMWHGFLLDTGSFTIFDVPDAFWTGATGINDSGGIVGWYQDNTLSGDPPTFRFHGFSRGWRLQVGTFFSKIDFPGARNSYLYGINNVSSYKSWSTGQIVGTTDSYHVGGLLDRGSYTAINYPGASWTGTAGINSPDQNGHYSIVGSYTASSSTHGFLATPRFYYLP